MAVRGGDLDAGHDEKPIDRGAGFIAQTVPEAIFHRLAAVVVGNGDSIQALAPRGATSCSGELAASPEKKECTCRSKRWSMVPFSALRGRFLQLILQLQS